MARTINCLLLSKTWPELPPLFSYHRHHTETCLELSPLLSYHRHHTETWPELPPVFSYYSHGQNYQLSSPIKDMARTINSLLLSQPWPELSTLFSYHRHGHNYHLPISYHRHGQNYQLSSPITDMARTINSLLLSKTWPELPPVFSYHRHRIETWLEPPPLYSRHIKQSGL